MTGSNGRASGPRPAADAAPDAPKAAPDDVPVDVLIPTYGRPPALAVTLTALSAQTLPRFRVVIADQNDDPLVEDPLVLAPVRVLEAGGRPVEILRNLPRRGIAQQRQFLLEQARAPYLLMLDDDILTEPDLLERLLAVIRAQECGFVGSAMIGLSFRDDVRPHEQAVELWEDRVRPEEVLPGTPKWERYRLHNAANVWHVQRRLGASAERPLLYKVAWIAGCVLFDHGALRSCGGFDFWREVPEHVCGEDVLVQLRVMARHGGCAILPSGAYHLELPTTIPDRSLDAWKVTLGWDGTSTARSVLEDLDRVKPTP